LSAGDFNRHGWISKWEDGADRGQPEEAWGKPVVRGTRIPVALIVRLVAEGMTPEEIVREYPELTLEDVRAALRFAAKLAGEEVIVALE